MDVEPTAPIRQAENKAARDMIERVMAPTSLYPMRLVGDTGYGSAEMLGWLVYEHGIRTTHSCAPLPGRQAKRRREGTNQGGATVLSHVPTSSMIPMGTSITVPAANPCINIAAHSRKSEMPLMAMACADIAPASMTARPVF